MLLDSGVVNCRGVPPWAPQVACRSNSQCSPCLRGGMFWRFITTETRRTLRMQLRTKLRSGHYLIVCFVDKPPFREPRHHVAQSGANAFDRVFSCFRFKLLKARTTSAVLFHPLVCERA